MDNINRKNNSPNALNALLEREFPVEENLIYLNHAAVAPWPRRTAEAVKSFANECTTQGSRNFNDWLEVESRLRQTVADMIHAPSADDIGFVKNTSEGLSMVACGFPWTQGDNVVISDEEFPSNRIVWQSLADKGVEVRQVSLKSNETPESALLAATDNRTRMIAISAVQYASGLRMDLETLGTACRDNNIAFCVDAIQALGAIRQDVEVMHIDFLVADAHKWMLGPEGIGVFYCSSAWRAKLKLHEFGWHMVEQHFDFSQLDWQPSASARRFECGSNNMLGIQALSASLSLLNDIGMDEVERRVVANAGTLIKAIEGHPALELLSDPSPGRIAGIVTFRHIEQKAEAVHEKLSSANVLCALRGGGVRFSPHCYANKEKLLRAVEIAGNRNPG